MDNLLNDEEKQLVLQKNRNLYGSLKDKMHQFSHLNIGCLKPNQEDRIKKACVHRKRENLSQKQI